MKKNAILFATVFVVICITPAFGQWETHATVAVPFEFSVGDTVLPAGSYAVLTHSLDHAIQLLNTDTGASAYALQNDIMLNPQGSMISETKLVFRRDGDRHVLHQIRLVEDDHVHDIVHETEILELAQAQN